MPPFCEKHQSFYETDRIRKKICCEQCEIESTSAFSSLPKAIKATESPSEAAADKGLILTEEELHEVGNLINELHYSRQISDQLHTEVENVLVSHRALNERNRLLVQENDELNHNDIVAKAKVQEYYLGLKNSVGKRGLTALNVYHATNAIEQVLQAFNIKILEVNDYE